MAAPQPGKALQQLADQLATATDPTGVRLHIATITAINSAGKVQTDQTGAAWIARSMDLFLKVADRVWLIQQSSVFIVAGRVSGMPGSPWAHRKLVVESVVSSTTLQNDDEFAVTLVPGIYRVEGFFHVSGDGTANKGGMNAAWTFSGTLNTSSRACFGPANSTTNATATVMRSSGHNLGTTISYGTDGSTASAVHEDLYVDVATAGILQFQWAQWGSSTTATTVSAASRMFVTPANMF